MHRNGRAKIVDLNRPPSSQRGYGGSWRKLRAMVLNEQPICQHCRREAATEVDHIVPLSRGGENTMENLQGLCKSCHSRKTAREDGGFGHGGT